ncbi:MAG: DUF3604 domain-containing protein [Clostridiales bacterium]|nr:DUF3604 domain-containing protein [Clostridiales bacterium]
MNIFWGDLHNHCGITYGMGSLENALKVARNHLDFATVTPHAFWPDMPPRAKEIDYLIDFHERGFAKIAEDWESVKAGIDEANEPGAFTSLFSFEMHSSRYGDHHFVSPDRALAIAQFPTPRAVMDNCAARAIAVPHHVGYTPGYRGIDWDSFDGRISPVVEVISKHGCAMHEKCGFPYYHDMGPLDPRNTVHRGLMAGRRFGFVGSTDHHAGFPGSFGDGKLAVLSEENTREAIFRALKARRTYAVTGSRIRCGFEVNGENFGGEIPSAGGYDLRFSAVASNAIDRIVLYQDLTPIRVVDGWALPETGGRHKLRLELGWGDNADAPHPWDVHVKVENGRILGAEQCLRGRSVLSPTQRVHGGDDINRCDWGIRERTDGELRFFCETWRNNSTLSPSTAQLVLEIEGGPDARLVCEINGIVVDTTVGKLADAGLSGHLKPYNSQAYKLHTAVPYGKYAFEGALRVPDSCAGFFHMEVRQFDGDAAYVSPVFVNR